MTISKFKTSWLGQMQFQSRAEQTLARSGLKQGGVLPLPDIGQQKPHDALVTDPIGSLASADIQHDAYKASCGFKLVQQGISAQTAADLEYIRVAQESSTAIPASEQQVAPVLQTPQFQQFNPNRAQPFNPMSSVPGYPGPFGMPKPQGS